MSQNTYRHQHHTFIHYIQNKNRFCGRSFKRFRKIGTLHLPNTNKTRTTKNSMRFERFFLLMKWIISSLIFNLMHEHVWKSHVWLPGGGKKKPQIIINSTGEQKCASCVNQIFFVGGLVYGRQRERESVHIVQIVMINTQALSIEYIIFANRQNLRCMKPTTHCRK